MAQYPKEKEAIGSKIISLINLGKSEEAISFIKLNKCESEYHLEYAYALYDSKKFKESIDIINSGSKNESTNILLAQNYYKLSEYEKAYEIYKKLSEEKLNQSKLKMKVIYLLII